MSTSVLLAVGMVAGASLLLLTGFPVAFVLAGTALGTALLGAAFGAFKLSLLTAFPQGVFGTMTSEVLVAVPLFVLMGVMLERARIAEDLLLSVSRLFGRVPGGLAIAVSLVGAVLAASTGIVGATVVTMGLMSLPVMLARGYDKGFASGSIAAAGTLGQIIPPSIVLVILGDQLASAYQTAQLDLGLFPPRSVTVNDLFAGALLPGLLLVGLYVVYQIGYAAWNPEAAPPAADDGATEGPGLARALVAPLLLVAAVLGSILAGIASSTEAAGVGAIGALLLAGWRLDEARSAPILVGAAALAVLFALPLVADTRLGGEGTAAPAVALALTAVVALGIAVALLRTWQARDADGERVIVSVCRSTLLLVAMIFSIVIGARLFSLVFIGLGGGEAVGRALQSLPGGTLGAVAIVMLALFLLGSFLEFLEIVYIVVPVVAPALLKMTMPDGTLMDPVWLGIMIAVNLQTSFLTPPVGATLFYLRGVAPPEVATLDIYRGVVPFVLLQLTALVLLWFWPALATWLPEALYPG